MTQITKTQVTRGFCKVGDGQLYYEIAGEGMPLVLSHAAFLDSRMFDEIIEPLALHYRVIRYDMRGFGQSSVATGPVCRRRDLAQLLDHLDIAQAHLVGCSNGGQLSLDLALEQPDRVASLTLVNSTPGGFDLQGTPPRYILEMMGAVQQGDKDRANELQIRIWLDGEFREPDQIDPQLRQKALSMNRIFIENNTFFIADMQPADPLDPPANSRLDSVQCPTFVVVGALDNSEILRAADEMARKIPHARKALMDGAAHVPSYEQPEVFTALLINFLSNH